MEIILLALTLISLTVAIAVSVFAWQLMRADRLRSEARIAALAAAIGDDDRTVATTDTEQTAVTELPLREEAPSTVPLSAGIFGGAPPSRRGFRLVAATGAGAVVAATVIGVLVVTSGGREASAPAAAARGATPAEPAGVAATSVALELVALGHEREADRLTVRGVVRNGSATTAVGQLTAVVLLFNRDGGFVASGRADVDGAAVAPGAERTFVVSVPTGAEVARYRVSFRRDDHVVPHVDRRNLKI
jgi:hypothetical protein